ncbi:DIP1984 family protein [Candidatus Aerophobetes bacterium]|nr:DIP1984 family protein [Candidatus Aerophobetes bacterium]
MKLAEALIERKRLKDLIQALTERAQNDILVEDGDSPAEDVNTTLDRIEKTVESLISISCKINQANFENEIDGKNLHWWIQKRDALKLEHSLLQRILSAASPRDSFLGRSKNEIKLVPTYSISELRKKIDHIAKKIRKIDAKIQAMNWQVEI